MSTPPDPIHYMAIGTYTIVKVPDFSIHMQVVSSGGDSGSGKIVGTEIEYSGGGGGGAGTSFQYNGNNTLTLNISAINIVITNPNGDIITLNNGDNSTGYGSGSPGGFGGTSAIINNNQSFDNLFISNGNPGEGGKKYVSPSPVPIVAPKGGIPGFIIADSLNSGYGADGSSGSGNSIENPYVLITYFSSPPEPEPVPDPEPVSINSCTPFPINYVPDPPRLWSREQYGCPPNTDQDPLFYEKLSERRKAEIFKYKNNANNMSKKQRYANFARGRNYTGKQSWATQSATYTDPNVQKDTLMRSGATYNSTLGVMDGGVLIPIKPCANKNCAMSYENDTPGPARSICLNPAVPLYNFKVKRTYRAGGGKWPYIGGKPWNMALYRLQAEK